MLAYDILEIYGPISWIDCEDKEVGISSLESSFGLIRSLIYLNRNTPLYELNNLSIKYKIGPPSVLARKSFNNEEELKQFVRSLDGSYINGLKLLGIKRPLRYVQIMSPARILDVRTGNSVYYTEVNSYYERNPE